MIWVGCNHVDDVVTPSLGSTVQLAALQTVDITPTFEEASDEVEGPGCEVMDGVSGEATSTPSRHAELELPLTVLSTSVEFVADVVEDLQFSRMTLTILHCVSWSGCISSAERPRSSSRSMLESTSNLGLLGLRERPARLLPGCSCCCCC